MANPTPVFILEKQLDQARQEIEALRTVTSYTLSIITHFGGRVEIPDDTMKTYAITSWRHEFDGVTHIFSVESKP